MTIERFKARISGIGLEFHQVEKILTQAVRARHLSVRFDHQNKCIRFESDTMEAVRMKTQLTRLARSLTTVVGALDGPSSASDESKSNQTKQIFFASCKEQDAEDNARVVGRKAKIEAMKDAYEKRQLEEAKLAADLKKRMQQSAGSRSGWSV